MGEGAYLNRKICFNFSVCVCSFFLFFSFFVWLVTRVTLTADEDTCDMRVGLRVDTARACLTGRADDLCLGATEPPGNAVMLITEDLVLRIAIDLCGVAARVPGADGRRRRKRLLEERKVCSSGKMPDLITSMPASTSSLESVLDREGISRDADASVRESVRLHTGKVHRRLTRRHLIQSVCFVCVDSCGGCLRETEKSHSIFSILTRSHKSL